MCFCRRCWRSLSTSDWDIRECEARPMMTCWMNLWRLCRTGMITVPFPFMPSAIVILKQTAHGAVKRNMLSSLAQSVHAVGFRGLELKSQMIQFYLLWTKFWLLSSVDHNSASWLNGNASLLKSDQSDISAIDFSGMILSRQMAESTAEDGRESCQQLNWTLAGFSLLATWYDLVSWYPQSDLLISPQKCSCLNQGW